MSLELGSAKPGPGGRRPRAASPSSGRHTESRRSRSRPPSARTGSGRSPAQELPLAATNGTSRSGLALRSWSLGNTRRFRTPDRSCGCNIEPRSTRRKSGAPKSFINWRVLVWRTDAGGLRRRRVERAGSGRWRSRAIGPRAGGGPRAPPFP